MLIDFTAYSADCLISGRLELAAPRLTDMLNDESTIRLSEVVLEGLEDARRIEVASYSISRDDLYAIKVTGPRGSKALRILTVPHRVQVQIGPYNVLGRLNAAPEADPLATLPTRGSMVPLTDATIAYVVGGILEVRDASTVIINRELSNWVRSANDEPASAHALHARAVLSDVGG